MDSLRNLPIYLQYADDGTVVAHCPLLPDFHCTASSRTRALRSMQKLIDRTFTTSATADVLKSHKYEIVFLAVAPSSDSVNHFSARFPPGSQTERARIEIL